MSVDPPGRPGWHLECSAMALRLLGEPPIDIHAGGIDLVFPHHENEIAQSEGATGQPFSRFWVHVEYLLVDDQKMSKSLGNTYTVPDLSAKGYRPSARALPAAVGALSQAAELHLGEPDAGGGVAPPAVSIFWRASRRCPPKATHEQVAATGCGSAAGVRRRHAKRPQHRRGAGRDLRAGPIAQLVHRRRRARTRRSARDSRRVRRCSTRRWASFRCAGPRTSSRPCRSTKSKADRGAQRRPAPPGFRHRRSHSGRARGTRRAPGGFARRDTLEEEIEV